MSATLSLQIGGRDTLEKGISLGKGVMTGRYTIYARGKNHLDLCCGIFMEKQRFL